MSTSLGHQCLGWRFGTFQNGELSSNPEFNSHQIANYLTKPKRFEKDTFHTSYLVESCSTSLAANVRQRKPAETTFFSLTWPPLDF